MVKRRKKHEKGGEGALSPSPAAHLSFAGRDSRQSVPCFPHPLDANSTPTKPNVEKSRRNREVTGKTRRKDGINQPSEALQS